MAANRKRERRQNVWLLPQGAAAALATQLQHKFVGYFGWTERERERGSVRERSEAGLAVRAQIKIKLQVPIMCEIPTLLACLLLCALNEVALATHTHDSHTHTRLSHTCPTPYYGLACYLS